MEAQIIGALIAAAGGLFAAVTSGIFALKAAKQKKLAEGETVAAEKMAEELGELSTYEIREFEAITRFDDAGNGDHTRRWIAVKTTQSINNLKISCKFQLSPGAQGERPTVEELPGSQLSAHFDIVSQTETVVEGNIVLEGMITPDTGYVGFSARQQFVKAFCLTREEALAAYCRSAWQTEYAVSGVTVPAKVLRRSVHFPQSHSKLAPPPKAIVFLGDDEVVDSSETARVKDALTVLDDSATLVVHDPKMGRRYGISWMPPQAH